ncbi:hypothetical protein NQ166_08815 [Microbacterium sp. zg.Y1090]|uniref:hypothetical protein n=1 Tax=Microbacterium wangruii TaxID=3049073 RepID=UPI00214D50D9|nr:MULTISPECIES: hypothetical protein [unclassified Microbacterium]MCR2818927.1 hypothetical protein [Microbacterium sp. zg.Y1090]WIM27234.1 hypothetical protein QNO26_08625 [Microbacterium sp. zg-Y1090]
MSDTTNTKPPTTSGLSIAALVTGLIALLLAVGTTPAPTFLVLSAGIVAIALGLTSARSAGETGIWLSRLGVLTGVLTLVVLGIMSTW